jgi:hypothetical protein
LVNGGRVTSAVRALGGQRFLASFIPHSAGRHTVEITFNGDTIPGNSYSSIHFQMRLKIIVFICYSPPYILFRNFYRI